MALNAAFNRHTNLGDGLIFCLEIQSLRKRNLWIRVARRAAFVVCEKIFMIFFFCFERLLFFRKVMEEVNDFEEMRIHLHFVLGIGNVFVTHAL